MIPRPVLAALVFGIPVLLALLALVLGGYGLSHAMGDPGGAWVLGSIAVGLAILLGANVILLVLALGVKALEEHPPSDDDATT